MVNKNLLLQDHLISLRLLVLAVCVLSVSEEEAAASASMAVIMAEEAAVALVTKIILVYQVVKHTQL
jgi:hypothetical protein